MLLGFFSMKCVGGDSGDVIYVRELSTSHGVSIHNGALYSYSIILSTRSACDEEDN
jgi:hypothetical protein